MDGDGTLSEPVAPTEVCVHHWILGTPTHDSTSGVCKLCGVSREFNDAYQPPTHQTPRAKAARR